MHEFTSKAISKALSIGFTDALWMEDLNLVCEARLREYCNPKDCPEYGNNWVCPPGCGSLEECAEKVSGFDSGFLLRSVSDFDPATDDYQELNREHNLRLREFIEACCTDREILALTNGGCVFCESCTFPKPCIKPDLRMNSLSAYGIDVGELCKTADLEYSFRPDKLYYVALVLMK